ncbi:glycosyl hydrolase family 65 protein [Klebsiella sp. BIGb0407]|uniref:glycosyl hydrolase family 65 protein n=1 Tax=Klebsiella sp. BIGb0407 TaxID=2940603 RepID=UPI002167A84B|nr:glycosyl hydrolase family 65 protein [Klebsiella sp. BIGb0407]MCS3429815.1 trehalose/maltose hydrolase-like predicted phosphorylase [Klebsiella sp. BIGb0407]
MLTISYGEHSEDIVGIESNSSSFAASVATLANRSVGVRPHMPKASPRTRRSQLLLAGAYAAGVGVSREIISLPAPIIMRLYDVDTGEPLEQLGDEPSVVLALDQAMVSSCEQFQLGDVRYQLTISQFIDAPDDCAVSTRICLKCVGVATSSHRLRLDYGVDGSALNEYLGACDWLTTRHYDFGQSVIDQASFSVIVETAEQRLRYDVRIEPIDSPESSIVSWRQGQEGCVASVTLDFATVTQHRLATHWRVGIDSESSPPYAFFCDFDVAAIQSNHLRQWHRIWSEHEVTVETASQASTDLGMKYAVFQLLQHGIGAVHGANGVLSPARGLTSTYHSGATFFDTELHKCIFWIWNEPDVAKALIDYRCNSLEIALEFARAHGFLGARFPEASNDKGRENGPHYVLSYPDQDIRREWSVHEVLHISADVCYAVYKYWKVTGDDSFMASRGYEVLIESARFAASVFKWSESRQAYVVNSVMGPDEYHYHVDNSFFTNYMLRWCIRLVLSLLDRPGFPRLPEAQRRLWQSIADNVYLPWITVGGVSIPEEFEGYAALPDTQLRTDKRRGPQFANEIERGNAEKLQNFDSQLVKQADIVLLMSMFPDDFSEVVRRAAFDYYEPRTVHESSLSYGPHAVVAAHLGKTQISADFISRASRYNLDFTPVDDYSNGLHLSAYAGAWQGLVEGLSGLDIGSGQLAFRPRLPAHWDAYHFTLQYRGRQLRVSVLGDDELEIHEGNLQLITERGQGRQIFLKEGRP